MDRSCDGDLQLQEVRTNLASITREVKLRPFIELPATVAAGSRDPKGTVLTLMLR